jgi:hypothetical protein
LSEAIFPAFPTAVPAVSIVAEVAPAATSAPRRKPLLLESFFFSIFQSPYDSESVHRLRPIRPFEIINAKISKGYL